MSKSKENLAQAFAGESQANRKYLAFAQQADKEGYKRAAKLFRAAAEAETIHAFAHLKAMGGIADTAENLKAAVAGETFEYKTMYPPMIETAKAEGDKAAERSFTLANAAEAVHAALYQEALDTLSSEGDTDFYLCTVCGHIAKDHAPDKCPICTAGAKAFKKID